MVRLLIFLGLLSVVAGCGFHLAGGGATALDNVAVVYEQPYRVVPPPLIDALNARLAADSGDGRTRGRLVIEDLETVRRVSAVSPEDARATAYELVTTVHYKFLVDGELRLADQSLSTRREYSFDNSQRLAAGVERRELLAAMQKELADLILLRLETALGRGSEGSE